MPVQNIITTPDELEIFRSLGEGASWQLNFFAEDRVFVLTHTTQYGMSQVEHVYVETELPLILMDINEIEGET